MSASSLPASPSPFALSFQPPQGEWTVEQWAAIDDDNARWIELNDGCLEVLPMPNKRHHFVTHQVAKILIDYFGYDNVYTNGLKVGITTRTGRVPDILAAVSLDLGNLNEEYMVGGVDLAVEVVSEGRRQRNRDYVEKPEDYSSAGIAEYWIVDPEARTITICDLRDGRDERTVFAAGETVRSQVFENLTATVDELFPA